jgi:arabinan endo-1,5-alpha-L-arabinosidase
MKTCLLVLAFSFSIPFHFNITAQNAPGRQQMRRPNQQGMVNLDSLRWRDMCILADQKTKTYYIVGPGGRSVRQYRSKDLITWEGPKTIYTAAPDVWGSIPVVGIWAPEMHYYNGKYYLFLTFDTRNKLCEQWPDWERAGRVTRGSQILVGDSPEGPFAPFENHSTLPADMMTLDGTLYVEDGLPYMVYCHEWVQVTNGAVGYVQLKEDLSGMAGAPKNLFRGSQAPWSKISDQYGCNVTDGPYLYKGKTGKLYMIWTSGGYTGYTCGIAISESGKLAGPWKQQTEPLYKEDGGHGMLFTTFDGKLMMVLHSPNNFNSRPRIFEMEDTGETLKVVKEFKGTAPDYPPC